MTSPLERLLAATPPPPRDATPEQLLVQFDQMLDARASVLATLEPPIRVADAERPLLHELELRQYAWQDALAAAQQTVGTQRQGVGQLRAYGGL